MATPATYSDLVTHIIGIINILIPAVFAIVFLYFVWKMIDSWIIHAGDEKSREEGKQYAVAAVIAFVVMVSVWGIVAMIKSSIFG
jgi:TRAP-type mannitol/chloroaromatic compound transport system permease small subunit